jgi:uncharacterized protein involved in response to NO
MATTAERVRTHSGPAILSYGFRPFFLLGAVWAASVLAVWLPMLGGAFSPPTAFSPLEWHVHELLYGYVPCIIAGFLLTAVPNWTGRLPVTGSPLLALVATWAAGRLAILTSARIGAALAAVVDLLFLGCLAGVIAREIVAGRNVRNIKVLALLVLFLVGNAVFHWETMTHAVGGYGMRLGIGVILLLITLIGGRIIPSFTRNWLARRPPGPLPIPFGRFDVACLGVGTLTIACWIADPSAWLTAAMATLAGCLHAVRLARWAGYRTIAEPLVLVPARRLRLCADRLPAVGPWNCCTGLRPTLRCPARLDRRRHRHDDTRRHDTRKLGSYRPGTRGLGRNPIHLRCDSCRCGCSCPERI